MAAPALNPHPVATPARVQSIDILRGAVMILMALDHTRDFLHAAAMSFSATDLSRTSVAIFLTRWITHFCAPAFMFTAGLSAFLRTRRRGPEGLSHFLWTRGLWLIVLEFTVVHLSLFFNFDYRIIFLLVFWALGCSMIALAGLVRLPYRVLLVGSLAVIALHDLADPISAARFGGAAPLWNLVHQPGLLTLGGSTIVFTYPLIPWIFVMAAGYCSGRLFLLEPDRRQRILVRLGIGLTMAFLIIRGINIYGDPAPWSHQPSAAFTVLSFLNCTKYPPSLDYLLMILGPALLVMGLLERVRLSPANPLIVFGRTPLFYFIVHLFLIHAVGVVLAYIRYGNGSFFFSEPPTMGAERSLFPADFGYGLAGIYLIWLSVVVALYPLCRWFAQRKQRGGAWWLGYL